MSKLKCKRIEKSAYDIANLASALKKHCECTRKDSKEMDCKYIEKTLWEILNKVDEINSIL